MSRCSNVSPAPNVPPTPALTGVAQLLSEMPVATLDLHGYAADQAQLRVRDFLTTHSRIPARSVVHVITGTRPAVLLELVRAIMDDEVANHLGDSTAWSGGGGFG